MRVTFLSSSFPHVLLLLHTLPLLTSGLPAQSTKDLVITDKSQSLGNTDTNHVLLDKRQPLPLVKLPTSAHEPASVPKSGTSGPKEPLSHGSEGAENAHTGGKPQSTEKEIPQEQSARHKETELQNPAQQQQGASREAPSAEQQQHAQPVKGPLTSERNPPQDGRVENEGGVTAPGEKHSTTSRNSLAADPKLAAGEKSAAKGAEPGNQAKSGSKDTNEQTAACKQKRDEELDCSLCAETKTTSEFMTTQCNHLFCKDCWGRWSATNEDSRGRVKCPNCRSQNNYASDVNTTPTDEQMRYEAGGSPGPAPPSSQRPSSPNRPSSGGDGMDEETRRMLQQMSLEDGGHDFNAETQRAIQASLGHGGHGSSSDYDRDLEAAIRASRGEGAPNHNGAGPSNPRPNSQHSPYGAGYGHNSESDEDLQEAIRQSRQSAADNNINNNRPSTSDGRRPSAPPRANTGGFGSQGPARPPVSDGYDHGYQPRPQSRYTSDPRADYYQPQDHGYGQRMETQMHNGRLVNVIEVAPPGRRASVSYGGSGGGGGGGRDDYETVGRLTRLSNGQVVQVEERTPQRPQRSSSTRYSSTRYSRSSRTRYAAPQSGLRSGERTHPDDIPSGFYRYSRGGGHYTMEGGLYRDGVYYPPRRRS